MPMLKRALFSSRKERGISRTIQGLVALLSLSEAILAQGQTSEGPVDYVTGGGTRDYGTTAQLGDPISAGTGAYHFRIPLLSLGGPMDLRFELVYRSDFVQNQFAKIRPGTFWWRPRATASVAGTTVSYATIQFPDGNQVAFRKTAAGDWVLADPNENAGFIRYRDNGSSTQYVLKATSTYLHLMDPIEERVYIFQNAGYSSPLARILDRNGNQLIYTGGDWPTRIEDGLGRSLNLTYGSVAGATVLQTVTDQSGRRATLTYQRFSPSQDSVLTSVTDPLNQTTAFNYADRTNALPRLISSLVSPAGNTPFTQTYQEVTLNGSKVWRVISQKDALGNTTTLSYDSSASSVTERRPDGSVVNYEHFSNYSLLKALTDPSGKKAAFTKNNNEQLTGVSDRLGGATSLAYHAASGKLASVTNAKGAIAKYTYASQDQTFTNPANNEQVTFTFYNLTRVDYPDDTSEQFTYDGNGNVLTRVDQNGQTRTFTYNSRGQVLTATNPTGGVVTLTYNSDATLATRKDSDTGATGFSYDALKRPVKVTYPDGSSVQIAYDANNQITSITNENNRKTTFVYDANGNLTRITDPNGKSSQFTYDAMDRLSQVTNRLGKSAVRTYDVMGHVASRTDPTGLATSFGYDPRGWVNRFTQDNKNWRAEYDDEGVLSSTTTPLGHTSRRKTDALGFLSTLTNPLEQSATFSRDALSRITGVTDPLGRMTNYSYDAGGQLTGVRLPVAGQVAYQRDGLGRLTRLTDLNGQNWNFSYTTMGRPAADSDPLGRTWQYNYDTRGRQTQTAYPDTSKVSFSYDATGNVIRQAYTDGPDLLFTYDALNRLAGANDLQFTYDAEGHITNTDNPGTRFGASYDDAGRLKTVTYNNGALTVSYSYDSATGLLTRVTDNLTNTQVTFSYDNDFRLTGMTRSNGVNATLTWDNAGRLTRIQEGSILDLQYTLDAAGQVTQLDLTAPLDPAGSLRAGTESHTYNVASQVSSTGYSYDVRGRLAASPGRSYRWDGASRLAGIDAVTLAYNGLGQLLTRTEAGTTLHFYYNHALALAPVTAEKNDTTEKFLRYYIWTPAGALLYMIDAADSNKVYHYHFDRTGSTLALTDVAGKVTDAYAYDPYGRLLARQGASLQPFTFVGRWGVRQEGTSGNLYHMRARYYDATTASFLSRDPVWPQITDPRQINPYQYAANDPTGTVDVTGLQFTLGYRGVIPEWIPALQPWKPPPDAAGNAVAGQRETVTKQLAREEENQPPSTTWEEFLGQLPEPDRQKGIWLPVGNKKYWIDLEGAERERAEREKKGAEWEKTRKEAREVLLRILEKYPEQGAKLLALIIFTGSSLGFERDIGFGDVLSDVLFGENYRQSTDAIVTAHVEQLEQQGAFWESTWMWKYLIR